MVERVPDKNKVEGPIPSTPTKKFLHFVLKCFFVKKFHLFKIVIPAKAGIQIPSLRGVSNDEAIWTWIPDQVGDDDNEEL